MLDKNDVLNAIDRKRMEYSTRFPKCSFRLSDAIKLIADLPEVDAVAVIRCNECEYFNNPFTYVSDTVGLKYGGYCKNHGIFIQEHDFCNYGVRRYANESDK